MDFAMTLTIRTSAKVVGVFTTQLTAIQYAIALSDNILFRTVKTIAFHFSPKVIPTRFLLTSDGSNKALWSNETQSTFLCLLIYVSKDPVGKEM